MEGSSQEVAVRGDVMGGAMDLAGAFGYLHQKLGQKIVVDPDSGLTMIDLKSSILKDVISTLPTSQVVQVNRNFTPIPKFLQLDVEEHTYPQGRDRALTAKGLSLLAEQRGLTPEPSRVDDLDVGAGPQGIRVFKTGTAMGPDGIRLAWSATKGVRFSQRAALIIARAKKKRLGETDQAGNPLPPHTADELELQVLEDQEHLEAKALANTTPVMTPRGYRPMGDLRVGDEVIGSDGRPTPIVAVHPQGEREMYRVRFSDGAVVICTDDHLWTVAQNNWRRPTRGPQVRTVPLQYMRETRARFRVPILKSAVEFVATRSPEIDPWLVGFLLGDGNLTRERMVRAAVGEVPDQDELTARIRAALPADVELVQDDGASWRFRRRKQAVVTDESSHRDLDGRATWAGRLSHQREYGAAIHDRALAAYAQYGTKTAAAEAVGVSRWYVDRHVRQAGVSCNGSQQAHSLLEWVRRVGLSGKGAWDKRIPRELLYGSVETRVAVLQGYADADGSVTRSGGAQTSTCSLGLAEDVRQLVLSLGGVAVIARRKTSINYKGRIVACRDAYKVTFRVPDVIPFRLTRKVESYRGRSVQRARGDAWNGCNMRAIKNIEPVGVGEATCITVANPDGLFATADCVLTHNCETGAWNRVIRSALNLKGTYSRQELKKPFLVVTYVFTPWAQDPHIKQLMQLQFSQGRSALYGPTDDDDGGHLPAAPRVRQIADSSHGDIDLDEEAARLAYERAQETAREAPTREWEEEGADPAAGDDWGEWGEEAGEDEGEATVTIAEPGEFVLKFGPYKGSPMSDLVKDPKIRAELAAKVPRLGAATQQKILGWLSYALRDERNQRPVTLENVAELIEQS